MNPVTAILLFSRTAAAEVRSKDFGAGPRGSERLAARLIARTEATVARTGLPVFRSNETNQRGGNFGERLTNALTDVYTRGYTQVLVVGNDCPFVRTSHLRAAARQLAAGRNVIGPDRRGGIWLLGLRREDFRADLLMALAWQTENTFAELTALLPNAAQFARFADINLTGDLRREWSRLRALFADLGYLILSPVRGISTVPIANCFAAFWRFDGRGPPALV